MFWLPPLEVRFEAGLRYRVPACIPRPLGREGALVTVRLRRRMNYRHAFHAGNFADLLKHASLIAVLSRLLAEPGPITVVDTHAGAGLYDLAGPEAERSREARSGAARLIERRASRR